MSLIVELLCLAQELPPKEQALVVAAANKLQEQRLWRDAWLDAENRVDLLTKHVEQLRLIRNRKEKECND